MTDRRKIFLLLFFFSGGTALIYEVAWTRQFTPIIGNTVFSTSAILTVFMAGLALGSRIFGRFIDRRSVNLIRVYALLEAGIGLYSLAIPGLLRLVDPIFGALYISSYDSFALLSFGRLAISVGLLIVPATLMGGTLPILIRYYTDEIDSIGLHAGRVYTVNTLGAAIGTASAGFLLIPFAGVRAALLFAAVLNLAIAAFAWFLSRGSGTSRIRENPANAVSLGSKLILIAMFLSGFAALVSEVAWTRVLGLIVGPTTYAFTLMLTAMIAGLGVGAWLGSRWTARRTATLGTFAWIQIGVGLASLAIIPLFGQLPLWIGVLVRRYVESFGAIYGFEFLIFFSIMLVPTTLLGATFPIAAKLYARSNALLGTEVSAVYAANTVGGILGSLAAGFLLVPLIGSQKTLMVASFISISIGVILTFRFNYKGSRLVPKTIVVLTAFTVLLLINTMPRWNPELMSSGAYKYAPYYGSQLDLEAVLTSGELLYFDEGMTTTVSVKRDSESTMLAVDGKIDATDSGDMLTQKMLGHLPLLLSKEPRKVVNVGLGSGVTAGAALSYPIEKLDIIEISPQVVEASSFFDHVNNRALHDKRVELIIGDGRNHLRYSRSKYDVSISEPSNPWMAGMSSLFTREFFEEVRERLTEEGIHCQWLHSYNMSSEDIRTVVRTFRSAFPYAALWVLNKNDFLLLGSSAPIEVREETVRANFDLVSDDLLQVRIQDLYSMLSLFVLRDEDLDKFAGDALLNTDDFPLLEFRSPRFMHANTAGANMSAILEVEKDLEPPRFISELIRQSTSDNHRKKAEMLLFAGSYEAAALEFQKALDLDVTDKAAWDGLIQTDRGQSENLLKHFIEEKVVTHPEPIVLLAAADHYRINAEYTKAVEVLTKILEVDSEHVVALELLCDVLAEEGNLQLAAFIERLLHVDADNARGLFHLATIRQYQGRLDEAIETINKSIAADPSNIRARNLLAILYSGTFQFDRAAAEFMEILGADPLDAVSHTNYGLFLLERGRFHEALEEFKISIDIAPDSVRGFIGVAETLRRSGLSDEAEEWYRKALKLAPDHPIANLYVNE